MKRRKRVYIALALIVIGAALAIVGVQMSGVQSISWQNNSFQIHTSPSK